MFEDNQYKKLEERIKCPIKEKVKEQGSLELARCLSCDEYGTYKVEGKERKCNYYQFYTFNIKAKEIKK